MNLHWIDFAFIGAMVAAGSGIIYFLLLRRFDRALAAGQRDLERRLAALTEQITMRKPESDESGAAADELDGADFEEATPHPSQATGGARVDDARIEDRSPSSHIPSFRDEGDVPAEIQVAIAAAAIAAFGNHARIRSARRIPSSDVVSPWTQQGRVIVQSSHNLRMRG